MYVFVLAPMPEQRRFPDEELVPEMHALLSEFRNTMADIREQITDPNQVVVRPLWTCLVRPPWHRGRVVLIGDAVHAPPSTLATGGGMAMEDAVVLDEVLTAGPTLDHALTAFTDRRWPRTRDSVQRTIEHLDAIIGGVPGAEVARLESEAHAALSAPL